MIEAAATDASNVMKSAKKTLTETAGPMQRAAEGGMSRPSWSIVS